MAEYFRRWERLRPILESIRDREVREVDTQAAILSVRQAFQIALRDLPPRESSGLVEWQRYMKLWRENG